MRIETKAALRERGSGIISLVLDASKLEKLAETWRLFRGFEFLVAALGDM